MVRVLKLKLHLHATYNITRGAKPKWPREENARIPVEFESLKKGVTLRSVLTSDEIDKREDLPAWNVYDSLLYNEWLRIPIATTKFIDIAVAEPSENPGRSVAIG